jgi:hypothetical protein
VKGSGNLWNIWQGGKAGAIIYTASLALSAKRALHQRWFRHNSGASLQLTDQQRRGATNAAPVQKSDALNILAR